MLDGLETKLTEAKSLPVVKSGNIELGFFSKGKNAFIDIANESAAESFKLDQEGLSYEFSDPVFIRTVTVEGAQEEGIDINYAVQKLTGLILDTIPADQINTDEDGFSICHINGFVRKFKISSNRQGFFSTSEKVKKIKIDFFTLNDLEALPSLVQRYEHCCNEIDGELQSSMDSVKQREADLTKKAQDHKAQVEKSKSDLEAIKAQHQVDLQTLQAEIKTTEQTFAETDKKLKKTQSEKSNAEAELKDAQETLEKTETSIKSLKEEGQSLKNTLDERSAEISLKSQQVAQLNDQLQQLQNDVSLFADDAAGFARQAESQNKKYLILLVVCLVIGAVLAIVSIISTKAIFDAYVGTPTLGVWSLIAIKTFLFVLMGFAYTYLYKFGKPLVDEMIANNRKKLEISKVSILARDTSDSAAYGTDVTPKEKLQLKMATRMTFMREVLSGVYDGKAQNLNFIENPPVTVEREAKPLALPAKKTEKPPQPSA